MPSSKYDVFLKVLEMKSFSKAAVELGYTQSTVSHAVIQLESEFGFPLLHRSKKGLSLTTAGETILPLLQEAAECERKIQAKVSEINGVWEGSIYVGTYHTISLYWMPQIIDEFHTAYPGIHINHVHGNAVILKDLLTTGRIDCCMMDILPDETLEHYVLYREPYKVILPKDHAFRDAESFPLSRLDREHVEYVRSGKGLYLFPSEATAKPPHSENSCYTTDENLLLSMVERGMGAGLISEMAIRRHPYDVVVMNTDVPIYRELGIIMLNRNRLSPPARTFVKHILDNDYYRKATK